MSRIPHNPALLVVWSRTLDVARPHGLGADLLGLLLLVVLACAVLIASTGIIRRAAPLLAVQSSALAALAATIALQAGDRSLLPAALLTVVLKVVLVPGALLRAPTGHSNAPPTARTPVLITVGVMAGAYVLAPSLSVPGALVAGPYFPTAVAVILAGCLTLALRREPPLQAVGLLLMSNGIYVFAADLAGSPPLALGLDLAFDVLVVLALLTGSRVNRRTGPAPIRPASRP